MDKDEQEFERYHREVLKKATPEHKDELCMRALRIQRIAAYAGGACYNIQYKDEWDALYEAAGNVFGFANPIEETPEDRDRHQGETGL